MSFFNELKRRNVFRVGIAYTVAAWLLLQVTDIVFPRIGLPDTAITLVIALLGIGFIPALIFAWAFEMTPDGIKREKDVDRSQSITPHTSRKLDRAIIIILVLVITSMAAERLWLAGSNVNPQSSQATEENQLVQVPANTEEKQKSVAVLPFVSMSKGEDDGYFADGLTEEILNSLARLPELLVTARTSSFHFKDKNLPVPEIAATLGVGHIVEGSVRRSGDRVRITAQLVRAEDGFHLWSDTYDRTLDDIFTVQEDIAENIASTLDVVLNEDKRQIMRDAGIKNIGAFIDYQKAMEAFHNAHTTSDPGAHLNEANQWFDQALERVPGITNALYLRTDLYGHRLYNNASNRKSYTEEELIEASREIKTSLDKAWQYAHGDTQRAIMDAERTLLSDDWTGLAGKLENAFTPGNCTPTNWLSSVAVPYGWAAQAADKEREGLRCDPLDKQSAVFLTFWEVWNGNAVSAIEFADRYLQKQGFHPWLDDARFIALLASGQYRNDPDVFDAQPEGSSMLVPRTIFVHAMNNDIAAARTLLEDWQTLHEVNEKTLLQTEAALGNRQAANHYAGRIDARIGGTLVLTEVVKDCFCGAPFDLDATPTFKKRLEEAGFDWPPISPLQYPAKDWP